MKMKDENFSFVHNKLLTFMEGFTVYQLPF